MTSKLMFADATNIYNKYSQLYKKHTQGYIILGPPASGKTTFVNNQVNKHWIDADDLFNDLGVDWHYNSSNHIQLKLNYTRADYILQQSKLFGFRIIGSLFWDYDPDAIVIPPLDIHIKYINYRTDLKYIEVIKIRNSLIQKSKNKNIPTFNSCIEAVNYINSLGNT